MCNVPTTIFFLYYNYEIKLQSCVWLPHIVFLACSSSSSRMLQAQLQLFSASVSAIPHCSYYEAVSMSGYIALNGMIMYE